MRTPRSNQKELPPRRTRLPELLVGRALLGGLCVVETTCAAVLVAQQYHPLVEQRWVQDDAYVSFRYAKHLVEGHGLVYNIGERVEGYTNFLWTIFSAIPLALGVDDPLPFMHALGAGLWISSYLLLLVLGLRLFAEGEWAGPLALIPLTFHWSFNLWFVSGMETPLVTFLIIACLLLFTIDPEAHPWALFWTSLVGVMLMLTRPDSVFVIAGIAGAGLAIYWRELFVERKWRTYLLRPALPLLLIYVPYTLWRVSYYGEFFPNTYYAKVAYLTHYSRGWEYLRTYLDVYPFTFSLPFAVLGAVLAPPGATRRFLWGTLASTALVFFYIVRLGGDFMEWRFVVPVTGVLYPAIVIGCSVFAARVAGYLWTRRFFTERLPNEACQGWTRTFAWVAGMAATAALAVATVKVIPVARERIVPGQESIFLLSRYWKPHGFNWAAAGKTFDAILPQDVRIAISSAGIVPFFCDRHCLDLCALTDFELARRPIDPEQRGRMGHEHCTEDYEYSRDRGVDVYLHWVDPRPYPLSLVAEVPDSMEMASVQLPDGRYTEFVVLDKERVPLEKWRQDPRFVFRNSRPVADTAVPQVLAPPYAHYLTVDSLDLENGASHQAHQVEEKGPRHDWHTKMLQYREPDQHLIVHDTGFHVFDLQWQVRGVSTDRQLLIVFRVDRIGHGQYSLEVNGQPLPEPLVFPEGAEAWDEVFFEIPADLLVDGVNEFHLSLWPETERTTEMYYMWFLQPPSPHPTEQLTSQ